MRCQTARADDFVFWPMSKMFLARSSKWTLTDKHLIFGLLSKSMQIDMGSETKMPHNSWIRFRKSGHSVWPPRRVLLSGQVHCPIWKIGVKISWKEKMMRLISRVFHFFLKFMFCMIFIWHNYPVLSADVS